MCYSKASKAYSFEKSRTCSTHEKRQTATGTLYSGVSTRYSSPLLIGGSHSTDKLETETVLASEA